MADQGCDVRLRGIKIKSFWEWELNLNADMFQPERLVRYPLLEGMDADVLYRRAVLIQRYGMGTETGKDGALASSRGYTPLNILQLLSRVWHQLEIGAPCLSTASVSAMGVQCQQQALVWEGEPPVASSPCS